MANVVVTLLGDDRAGLVGALARVVAQHGANWRSHMAELAGKFAGIVLVTAPDSAVEALAVDLEGLEAEGLFEIQVERASDAAAQSTSATRVLLELVGQDHPGIVYEVSNALAQKNVSIDELQTQVEDAPMGGKLFKATAALEVPTGLSLEDVNDALEAISYDLMVDLQLDDA